MTGSWLAMLRNNAGSAPAVPMAVISMPSVAQWDASQIARWGRAGVDAETSTIRRRRPGSDSGRCWRDKAEWWSGGPR
jgi:hypothetical protein